ncbi:MAG: hypothetical protein LQ350_007464 [Teloschistes chrysophthalmus]|nr:MAG: hypothetical protein LQ350_007464 [Niorma chrysophthalma]
MSFKDGGGIRGLSSLFILQNIMEKIRFIGELSSEPLPEKVFGRPQSFTYREKFDPQALEKAIKTIVEQRIGDQDALLQDPAGCNTFVCAYESKALGGSPMLLRTYPTGSAPVSCTIWEAARATSAAPTFFPPIRFGSQMGGDFIDGGVGCNNPTKVLVKEAKFYYLMKNYTGTQPTCLVSIGTGHKDLIQLHEAASIFWFKDRSGISIAPLLGEIATDCENTHDEVLLTYLQNNTRDLYYRFNVPQGMQQIMLDEWAKKNDIKTYTDKYLRLNQTEHELLDCVKRLLASPRTVPDTQESRNPNKREHPSPQRLRITQGGSTFQGGNRVYGGSQFQGNFIGSGQSFLS